MITEIDTKTIQKILKRRSCFFSFISFFIYPLIISTVTDELDTRTNEANVDIDAAIIRTMKIPIRTSGSKEKSISGTIVSTEPFGISVKNKCPNDPVIYAPIPITAAKTVAIMVPFFIAVSS